MGGLSNGPILDAHVWQSQNWGGVEKNPFQNCSQTRECQQNTFDTTFSGTECRPWKSYHFCQSGSIATSVLGVCNRIPIQCEYGTYKVRMWKVRIQSANIKTGLGEDHETLHTYRIGENRSHKPAGMTSLAASFGCTKMQNKKPTTVWGGIFDCFVAVASDRK